MTGAAIVALVAMLGGQQNGGGGLGGGGFGGSSTGLQNGRIPTPSDPLGFLYESSVTHILTPGDRGEWPLNFREGDVVGIEVNSRVFDPAIEIVDSDSKVLARNDDIADGVQGARLAFRIPDSRKYRCIVKGYKSAAGGEYSIKLRSFHPNEIRPGQSVSISGSAWFRLPPDSKEDYSIFVTTGSSVSITSCNNLGIGKRLFETNNGGSPTVCEFSNLAPGENYFYVNVNDFVPRQVFASPISKKEISVGSAVVKSTIPPGGTEYWSFDGDYQNTLSVPVSKSGISYEVERLSPKTSYDLAQPVLLAVGKRLQTYTFTNKGKFKVIVRNLLPIPQEQGLSLVESAKTWDKSKSFSSTLAVGECHVIKFQTKANEVLQFDVRSVDFDTQLELFTGGSPMTSTTVGESTDSRLIVPNTQPRINTIVVHAKGNGGGGRYTLSATPIETKQLKEGIWQKGAIKYGDRDLWSFNVIKGHAGILRIRKKDFTPSIQVFDIWGNASRQTRQTDRQDEVNIDVNCVESGVYRLWIASEDVGGEYEIKWVDMDR